MAIQQVRSETQLMPVRQERMIGISLFAVDFIGQKKRRGSRAGYHSQSLAKIPRYFIDDRRRERHEAGLVSVVCGTAPSVVL